MAGTPLVTRNFVHPRPALRARLRAWLHRHLFTAILVLCAAGLALVALALVAGW